MMRWNDKPYHTLDYELKKTYGDWMKKPRGERTKGVSYWDRQEN